MTSRVRATRYGRRDLRAQARPWPLRLARDFAIAKAESGPSAAGESVAVGVVRASRGG